MGQAQGLAPMALELMQGQRFNALALGVIDFKRCEFDTWSNGLYRWFDLASITKAFTVGLGLHAQPKLAQGDILLLAEHRAGLPIGGVLPDEGWREQILSYQIKSSPTVYSDYSPLRAQLEIEKVTGARLYDLARPYWDQEIVHWLGLKERNLAAPTGFRGGGIIQGEAHDPKAFVIREEIAIAGLFGTVEGMCKTMLKAQEKGLFDSMAKEFSKRSPERFLLGWDTVTDPTATLAGPGASKRTFGHLGFTGTSVWVDLERQKGHVILTNATQEFWYEKDGLNALRRALGKAVWGT